MKAYTLPEVGVAALLMVVSLSCGMCAAPRTMKGEPVEFLHETETWFGLMFIIGLVIGGWAGSVIGRDAGAMEERVRLQEARAHVERLRAEAVEERECLRDAMEAEHEALREILVTERACLKMEREAIREALEERGA